MKDYLRYFLEVKVIAGVVRVQARFPENHAHAGANVFKSTLVNQQ